ncbi:MAG TPA: 50S ribosomal protein L24 [Methanomassiliicoccales archaeon]|jgi:large subunit ribosomal protein L24|nr:50S ribosomal protein L24 [Methanomassiliicoccales archaeon]MCE5261069.1 50S ribosomal protein L24 [Euryarchaeota archaeon]HOE52787.1 50S ribosomal protein L24 [Methanomassiliicoccales archaeon]HOO03179.1 50S ribosomal protein L24 [Methanomassiliicoccales archaeon]HPD08552.1 50S ribosomal protein L24 [Methanomassiliicoccales archaeon]
MTSKYARKQRKALYNAPNHVRTKGVGSHLSDELIEKLGRRTVRVVKGDTVKVVRGDEDVRGLEGKVTRVDTQSGRLIIEGVTIAKADGTMTERPVHASNVIITKLDMKDSYRKQKLQYEEGSQ